MLKKSVAMAKATSVKHTLDELHTFVDALGTEDEKVRGQEIVARLHAKLNGLAIRAADFFEDEPAAFSGGRDKPEEN